VIPALAVLNSMLGVLLVPVAVLRLGRYRDRDSLLRLLVLLPGAALQLVPLITGATERGLGERPDRDPLSVAATYLRWGVPRSYLGPAWLDPPHGDPQAHTALVVAGLLIPAAVVVVALFGWTSPDWRLAGVLAGFAALAGAVQLAAHGAPEDRYLVLITLPNIAAAVALVRPRSVPAGGDGRLVTMPLVVLATLLTVVCAANLRVAGPRDGIPAWSGLVVQARAECHVQPGLTRVTVHIAQWPAIGWEVVLPCARLR
jgi:hypothetical protein